MSQKPIPIGDIIRNVAHLSWVAGMFEGEGTITITRGGRKGYTRALVTLTSTDKNMVDIMHKRWPGNQRSWIPKGNAKRAFMWTLNARGAIARFLIDMNPFFRTERVRKKAEIVMCDIGARVQGTKVPGYIQDCHERRETIAILNKRGIARPAMTLLLGAYLASGCVSIQTHERGKTEAYLRGWTAATAGLTCEPTYQLTSQLTSSEETSDGQKK